jgi:hypothetical protein
MRVHRDDVQPDFELMAKIIAGLEDVIGGHLDEVMMAAV